MKILLDTSVFISIFAKDDHFDKAVSLFKDTIRKHEGYFCSMTINEIFWVLMRSGYDGEFINEKVDFIFSSPLKYLYPNYEVFLRSARIFDQYKLTFADCQIVSQGLVAGIGKIGSFDHDFEKVKEIERVESI